MYQQELWVVVGRPWMETGTGGAPTAADKDCCTMAEISVWIAWITKAKIQAILQHKK